MAAIAVRQLVTLLLSAVITAGTSVAVAVDSSYYLAGLGLHQETGRDIYLGAIFLPQGSLRPDSLAQLSGPRIMSYTVVARRTSIRSLLGGILLQSEVATGHAPSAATSELANTLLSRIRGSLYAGDALEFALSAAATTTVTLNAQRLTEIADAEVANYLLAGWTSDNGPSTMFRNSLMAHEVNPALLALQQANVYSTVRQAEVAAWFPAAVEAAPEEGRNPIEVSASALAATNSSLQPGDAAAIELQLASLNSTDSLVDGGDSAALVINFEMDEKKAGPGSTAPPNDNLQLAALMSPQQLSDTIIDSEILSLGVQEYAQRLAEFNSRLIARVYGKIRYPQRAVKRNLQGRLELDIILRTTGELVAVSVAQSSGHRILDKAAVKAAEAALSSGDTTMIDAVARAEFGSEVGRLTVPVPVVFKLTE